MFSRQIEPSSTVHIALLTEGESIVALIYKHSPPNGGLWSLDIVGRPNPTATFNFSQVTGREEGLVPAPALQPVRVNHKAGERGQVPLPDL